MLDVNKEKCTGCYACQTVCPRNCIRMEADDEGFWYPRVNAGMCVGCGLCERVCPPMHAVSKATQQSPVEAYAAYSMDADIRQKSSSGGVFTELARDVLRRGGVVFGAALDENLDVVHRFTETEAGLAGFRGSKYVQSRIGDAYDQTLQFLKQGRLVLFSGTPCQIGGLLAFVKTPYENLITQDIVCHGVPSPKTWQMYLRSREKDAGAKPQNVSFRNKVPGWKHYSLRFLYTDGTQRCYPAKDDPYMRAYVKNLSLRPSCYHCEFKGTHRQSDITLADFWGVEKVFPDMDDGKGITLMLVHSPKGMEVLARVQENLVLRKTTIQAASAGNPSMIMPSPVPEKRREFFRRIDREPFAAAVNRVCPRKSVFRRFLGACKRALKPKRG